MDNFGVLKHAAKPLLLLGLFYLQACYSDHYHPESTLGEPEFSSVIGQVMEAEGLGPSYIPVAFYAEGADFHEHCWSCTPDDADDQATGPALDVDTTSCRKTAHGCYNPNTDQIIIWSGMRRVDLRSSIPALLCHEAIHAILWNKERDLTHGENFQSLYAKHCHPLRPW